VKRRHCGALALLILAGAVPGGGFDEASAQQPTPEQIAAIRQSCRSDFMSHCAGVQPGGREALQCLKRNAASVSAPCKSALDAVGPKPAPAAAEPEPAAAPPANASEPAAAAPQPAPAEPAQGGPPPPAESPPGPGPTEAGRPGPRAATAVPPACRSEFAEHCPGVRPGGPVALRCLQVNAAALSPACRSALAGGGGREGSPPPGAGPAPPPPGATPPPAAGPPPAAVAPLGPIPPMMPRQAMQILSFCGQERWALCGNVPPGGGRIIECLAENAPRLSPPCYGAIARAIR
jgi:hypothetical protein